MTSFFQGHLDAGMKCNRYKGMMVFEKFYGISENFSGWRCVTCGEIIDQMILENRNLEESTEGYAKHRKIGGRYER